MGLTLGFFGIGTLITTVPKKPASFPLPAMIHGIGLLLILLSGFVLEAKLKLGFLI
jgi:hypothetical protein